MEMIAAADPPSTMQCGVTAHPLFVDKAAALQALYGEGTRVYVLVGYDTWVPSANSNCPTSTRLHCRAPIRASSNPALPLRGRSFH